MIATCFALGDAYEIIYSESDIESIVRYRGGVNSHGEIVYFDSLSMPVQIAIYKRMKTALKATRSVNDAITELRKAQNEKDCTERIPKTN